MLGGNNALGSVVHLDVRWTPPDYLDASPRRRLDTKGAFNVWQPAHFQAEWALLVEQLERIAARHVILATVPQVTIAPIARGWRGKVAARVDGTSRTTCGRGSTTTTSTPTATRTSPTRRLGRSTQRSTPTT